MVAQPQDFRPGKKNPSVRTVYIANDEEISDEYDQVREELALTRLRLMADPKNEILSARYDELVGEEKEIRERLRNNSLIFKFRSIGRKAFDVLINDHPLTPEVEKKIRDAGEDPKKISWNPETFAPALCKASLMYPEDFDISEAWDSPDWNDSELASLFEAALESNTKRRVIPQGKG